MEFGNWSGKVEYSYGYVSVWAALWRVAMTVALNPNQCLVLWCKQRQWRRGSVTSGTVHMVEYYQHPVCGQLKASAGLLCIEQNVKTEWILVGRDSAVGIATCFVLDGPGIESRLWAGFSTHVQTGPAYYTMGTGSLSWGYSGRGPALTAVTDDSWYETRTQICSAGRQVNLHLD